MNAIRKASLDDIPGLVALMEEFYAEAGHRLNHTRAEEAFAGLVADDRLGCAWLIQAGAQSAGYVVATICYGMEFGGLHAYLDDLFVRAPFRRMGLASAALDEVKAYCVNIGVRAIHVETGRDNAAAQAAYGKAGFNRVDRDLLTLTLATPTHDA